MLTEAQKADVRRHLGYGPVGDLGQGASFSSYRFFVHHGLLEFRLNNLAAEEELILVGSGDNNNPVNPNFVNPADDVVHQGYLNICNFLEGQIAISTDNLDIKKAGEYEARLDESFSRAQLYLFWARKMASFLYLPMSKMTGFRDRTRLVN